MLRRLGMTRLIGHNAPVMGFPVFFYLTGRLPSQPKWAIQIQLT
jgi:hypothetical protein